MLIFWRVGYGNKPMPAYAMTASGVTSIGQGWTNARGLRVYRGPKPDPIFFQLSIFQVLGVSHLFYSTADFFVNTHFAFHHCFVFNGNFRYYFNNNKLFRKFKMGYGTFYVICPRASSQSVTPLMSASVLVAFGKFGQFYS